jgi:hypothetical protein
MPLLIAYQNSSPILLRRRQHRTQELLTLPPSENLINYNLDYTTLTSARATTAAATARVALSCGTFSTAKMVRNAYVDWTGWEKDRPLIGSVRLSQPSSQALLGQLF